MVTYSGRNRKLIHNLYLPWSPWRPEPKPSMNSPLASGGEEPVSLTMEEGATPFPEYNYKVWSNAPLPHPVLSGPSSPEDPRQHRPLNNSSHLSDFSRSGPGFPLLSQQWCKKEWSGHGVVPGLKEARLLLKTILTGRKCSNHLRTDYIFLFHWSGCGTHFLSSTSCGSVGVGVICRVGPSMD